MRKKRILVAPLNWGLGHAARCIPIIRKLEENEFEPILASDGPALYLLAKEFPHLRNYKLPSYNIRYTKKGKWLKWKLLMQSPFFLRVVRKEQEMTAHLVEKENLCGIISDSRLGVRYNGISNVIISHQLNVLSGSTTWLTSSIHRRAINRFDQCWIPDVPGAINFSGYLGHPKGAKEQYRYLGVLSRFSKKELPPEYDITILLSGPEPQRTLLENMLLRSFQYTDNRILFIRGVFDKPPLRMENSNIQVENYLVGTDLENALNASRIIISRSGYTTLLDLAKLEKKAFFIPTPGQFEQEYLAKRMKKLGLADFCYQADFEPSLLQSSVDFGPLRDPGFTRDFPELFALFKGE